MCSFIHGAPVAISADVAAPLGISFADVAGAPSIVGDSGEAYLVGACRPGGTPTAAVLRVGTDQSLTALTLVTARSSAACTWVTGRGLVVAGGSDQGAGIEVMASAGSTFAALPYDPDATQGAAAAALDDHQVLVVGGVDAQGQPAAVHIVDVSCSTACSAQQVAGDVGAAQLGTSSAFTLSSTSALVLGDCPSTSSDAGLSCVALLDLSGAQPAATAVSLHEPRSGAIATLLPNGMIGIVGGISPSGQAVRSIEVFTSPP